MSSLAPSWKFTGSYSSYEVGYAVWSSLISGLSLCFGVWEHDCMGLGEVGSIFGAMVRGGSDLAKPVVAHMACPIWGGL